MPAVRLYLLAAILCLGAVSAYAFVREYDLVGDPKNPTRIPIEWIKNRTVLMHLSLPTDRVTFSDGSSSYNAIAEAALNIWNAQLVHMKFAVDNNSPLPPSGTDADTSVTMADTYYGESFGGNTLAVTLVTPRNGVMIEADVVFNRAITWDSYRGTSPGAQAYDFRRVAIHEFGHVLGLDHPDQASPKQTVAAIMNSIVSYTIDDLRADDISGAHSIYDSGPEYKTAPTAPNLINLSTRSFVDTGEKALIGGFIIQGSQPTTVVLRAVAHSLAAFGFTNALNDPIFELHGPNGQVITNDDWIDGPDATTIASYHLDPANSLESALIATLNPGQYSVVMKSFDNGDGVLTGTALIELYDLHLNQNIPSVPGRAGNISTRGQVLTGDQVLIGGFIVRGTQDKTVIVRALGPSLGDAGVNNPLADPTLELRNVSGTLIEANDDWQQGPRAGLIEAEGFAPRRPLEAALQRDLAPGNYTAIVRGYNSTGIGLVEVYDLSPPPN